MSSPYYISPDDGPDRGDDGSSGLRWLALGGLLGAWLMRGRKQRSKTSSGQDTVSEASKKRGHEPEDSANVKGVVAFGIGLVILILIMMGVATILTDALGGREDMRPFAPPYAGLQGIGREPHLQQDPALDLRELRYREHAFLTSYSWVDQSRGIVRIPIDHAMEVIARRGLPTRDTTGTVDSMMVMTESGFLYVHVGKVPAPTSPAYLGTSPEPYAPTADIARQLGVVNTRPDSAGFSILNAEETDKQE